MGARVRERESESDRAWNIFLVFAIANAPCVPQQHDSSSPSIPAFTNVRTLRFLTDCVKIESTERFFDFLVARIRSLKIKNKQTNVNYSIPNMKKNEIDHSANPNE
jgi:hypothetical protein